MTFIASRALVSTSLTAPVARIPPKADAPPPNPIDPPVNSDRLVNLFMRLTQIPGDTYNERLIADAIKQEVTDIGFDGTSVKEDDAGSQIGGNAGNVIVNIPGNVPNAPAIMFSSHMDTVPLAVGCKPRLDSDGVIRTDGNTALGGDDRAGCSEILESMREIKENNLPHGPMQLVFCVGEEGGLLGSQVLNPADLNARYAFVMDVFKANQVYVQDRHLLSYPSRVLNVEDSREFTGGEAARCLPSNARYAGYSLPFAVRVNATHSNVRQEDLDRALGSNTDSHSAPPENLDLTDKEKDILDFTTRAMGRIGLDPEYYDIEWAGTDAISLRAEGVSAISLGAGEDGEHTRHEQMAVSDLVGSATLVRSIVDEAARTAAPPPASHKS